MDQGWIVYILECADGSFYTGITPDLEARLRKHENGTGAKYTRGRGPYRVVLTERAASRSEASKREAAIKAMTRQDKKALIESQ